MGKWQEKPVNLRGYGKMKRSKFSFVLAVMLIFCVMVPAVASAASVTMAYDGGSLNLRSGPGREYKSIGTVRDGDSITVLSYGEIWSKIKTASGKTGYIKNLYIDDGDDNYASGTDYFDSRYSVYATASVNLRSGASTGTAVIKTLSRGTKLTAMGKNNGFYLVQTGDGTQGYVSGSYVSRNKVSVGSSSASSSSSSASTKTVSASYVNMREGGGLSYDVVRVLPRGTKVTVLKKGNYWTRVSYKGTTGWIKNTYLK